MVIEITDANFDELVVQSRKKVALIDFWAEWCGPCQTMVPIISALTRDYALKPVVIGKVDVDKNPGLSTKFAIRSIPTFLFFKNGQVIDKHVGLATKAVLDDKLKKLLG